MTTKELIDYIEGELKKGEQKSAVKARLLQSDWSDEDVEEAFGVIDSRTVYAKSSTFIGKDNAVTQDEGKKPQEEPRRFFTILSVIGIFIGFNVVSVFFIWALALNYSIFIRPVTYLGEGQTDIGGWIFIVGISFFIISIVLSIFSF